ncbi:hypothetical protein CYY_005633 [Polysphondylium violaceum]|uniref:FNIP repeat-containing protein n=1 Tax=Polysphondylium violaceum TaxID=133409 RepID=A0A8J4UYL1_9MYCE|nr:hypothetical protein CYY_005633 [Polysphondylium violaceum]
MENNANTLNTIEFSNLKTYLEKNTTIVSDQDIWVTVTDETFNDFLEFTKTNAFVIQNVYLQTSSCVANLLPNTITDIVLAILKPVAIPVGFFPSSLKGLKFTYNYNFPLEKETLPQSITSLTIGYNGKEPFHWDCLPSNLESLTLQTALAVAFSQPIGPLPKTLKYLDLGSRYHLPLESPIPDHVKTLLGGVAPLDTTKVPSGLLEYQIAGSFDAATLKLPQGIKTLVVKQLKVDQEMCQVPESVTTLDLSGYTFQSQKPLRDILPSNLTCLNLGGYFNQTLSIGDLPQTLKSLNLGSFSGPLAKDVLPAGLVNLNMHDYNPKEPCPLDSDIFPQSLSTLVMPQYLSVCIPAGLFPDTLTSLELTFNNANQPMTPNMLPANLTNLKIASHISDVSIEPGFIPAKVTKLSLHLVKYNQSLVEGVLPQSVQELHIAIIPKENQTYNIPASVKTIKYIGGKPLTQSMVPNRSIDNILTIDYGFWKTQQTCKNN